MSTLTSRQTLQCIARWTANKLTCSTACRVELLLHHLPAIFVVVVVVIIISSISSSSSNGSHACILSVYNHELTREKAPSKIRLLARE